MAGKESVTKLANNEEKKKALDAAQKVLKDENATKEQIENVLAKLDAAKKALKKDTTPDTEKPTPTPETKVLSHFI